MSEQSKEELHKKKMKKQKENVDAHIAEATTERGVLIVLTGNGKGKSSSGFGMVLRALGYNHTVGVVQFIKGVQLSGEEIFLKEKMPEVDFYQMGTGFTWDTQDRSQDIATSEKGWKVAQAMLNDPSYDLVVLDELTNLLSYDYLDKDDVLDDIQNKSVDQHVVVTGRAAIDELVEMADTVSEIEDVKHAYRDGIQAQKGIDL